MLPASWATATARRLRRCAICWITPRCACSRSGWVWLRSSDAARPSAFASPRRPRVDPERLAKFVAGEAGAQFTPAGVLKFTLKEKQPELVLLKLKSLLEQLAGEQQLVI